MLTALLTTALVRIFRTILNRNVSSEILALYLILGKSTVFHHNDSCSFFSRYPLSDWESSISSLLKFLKNLMKWFSSVKYLFWTCWDGHIIKIMPFILLMWWKRGEKTEIQLQAWAILVGHPEVILSTQMNIHGSKETGVENKNLGVSTR